MTEPNLASEAEEAACENGSNAAPIESKAAVTDAEKKENELKKDEQEKDDVTAEDKETKHTSENGAAAETSNEVGDEKPVKDNKTVETEDVKMIETDGVDVNEDSKSVEPHCTKTVDIHVEGVKAEASEEGNTVDCLSAKKEDGENFKAEDAQDIEAGTTKDDNDVKKKDVDKVDAEDLKDVNADVVPMDAEDAEQGAAADVKLINSEGVEKDNKEDENEIKIAEKDGDEEEKANINKEEGGESIEKEVDLKQADDSQKKRPKGQKTSPGSSKKVKKDSAEKDKELQHTPVTSVDRPVRERKTVERLVEVISKEPKREFHVEKGRGTPLKNIPNVVYKLARKKPADIKLIHQTLFGGRGKAVDFKSHILQFSGFVWHESDEKQRTKMKEKLDKYVKDTLVDLCDLFDLSVSRTHSRKEELVAKLLDFLVAPHATTDVVLADDDQEKSRKRKTMSKGVASKSSGSPPSRGSRKKRTKGLGTPTRKGKNVEESQDEDDEDENSIDSSEEQKSAKYSESESKESESEESEKEDTDDGENPSKRKNAKKKISKEASSVGKEKSKMGLSPKKSPKSSSKSPKASSVTVSKARDDKDVGFSRKTKNVVSPKEKSTPKSSSKENDSGKKVGKGKAKSVETEHPTKEELRRKICEILKEVDFNTATFSDILKRLAAYYKKDLTPRKASLKLMIQEELSRLAEEAEADEEEEDDEDEE